MSDTNKIEVKNVEMPQYMICESMQDIQGVKVSIFRLTIEELIFEKMHIIFEKLFVADNKHEEAKIDLQNNRDKLLLDTDFETALGKKRTNKEEREAYIKPHLATYEDKVDEYEEQVKIYESKLKIINDLIELRKMELRIETALKEEE